MSEKIIKAGVIGWPVEHSLSPIIHNYWLKKYGINGIYEKIPVRPEELKDKLKELADKGCAGVNVTIPHKEAIVEATQYPFDGLVSIIRAANTITFAGEGFLENTDARGFEESLDASGNAEFLYAGKIVVIGAGGAARAILSVVTGDPLAEVIVVNRTRERAEKLRNDFLEFFSGRKIRVADWKNREEILKNARFLVNTTSLGMKDQPPLEISLENLPGEALVYDVIYNPLETELLKQANARGNKTMSGLDMLIYQAAPGFNKWFQPKEYPQATSELRQLLITALEKQC